MDMVKTEKNTSHETGTTGIEGGSILSPDPHSTSAVRLPSWMACSCSCAACTFSFATPTIRRPEISLYMSNAQTAAPDGTGNIYFARDVDVFEGFKNV